ncbi:siphovirus Gp157 family protein [Liquorilactobacillus vini]|uniref:siphovirus Gp157 family protein n=1 Tax=Liquorilactobacillus vini TaxID=238015 RepID=UPI0003170F03|nr:siphovirus Gp157 family protein [Liquorilactobacillus vini]
MNLFELAQNYKDIQNKDLDPELLKDTLDSIKDPLKTKADNIASWIDSNQSKIDFLVKRIQELRESKTALENQNKSLNRYLTDSLDQAGIKELQTDNHILKPRNYRPSVFIEDESLIPVDYIKKEEVTKVDKKALYTDLKAGKTINGAGLKPNRKVVIK